MAFHRLPNGRRYSDKGPAGGDPDWFPPNPPDDPRVHLPLSQRDATEVKLPDGTVLVTYNDQPADPAPRVPLPDPEEPLKAEPLAPKRTRLPKAPGDSRYNRWGAGPLPWRS